MTGAATIHMHEGPDVFEADACELADAYVTASGRWRSRTGPNFRRVAYSEPVRRTWPVRMVREIRWAERVAA